MKYDVDIEVDAPAEKDLDYSDHLALLSLITIASIVILWVFAAM